MAQIICLANSYKQQGRCIAGIDIDTRKWVRPVCANRDTIYAERFVDGRTGREPQLLDLLEIPIAGQAPDKGCQPENQYLNDGRWRRIRRLAVDDVIECIENTKNLLHNQEDRVDPEIFIQMPRNRCKSLQLIRVTNANFGLNPWGKKRCIFSYSGTTYELKVTDPIIINKIVKDGDISKECLFTISMATPFKSPAYSRLYCWKMIAGVIEL